MGQDWRPNRAISIELISAILKLVEQKAWDSPTQDEKFKWIMAGGLLLFLFRCVVAEP
jgi:hypothetical protein